MKLSGRRESTNFEDRRGKGGKIAVGGGIGAIIIAALFTLLGGGNAGDVVQQVINTAQQGGTQTENYTPTAQEEQFKTFALQILASTEDVWEKKFREVGLTYEPPKLVIFHGAVQSACGNASSAMGPFYCSADKCVYLDLDFFNEMERSLGAKGDFACAYVIAHEVGHHVQHLLGTLDEAHTAMSRASEKDRNQISVRLELQADYYAGVWGYHENQMFGSLESGDIEEAVNAAGKIGDDYLQKKGRGYSVPDSFTHGTSAQRTKWLKKGLQTGDVNGGDTFSPGYNQL